MKHVVIYAAQNVEYENNYLRMLTNVKLILRMYTPTIKTFFE